MRLHANDIELRPRKKARDDMTELERCQDAVFDAKRRRRGVEEAEAALERLWVLQCSR